MLIIDGEKTMLYFVIAQSNIPLCVLESDK